MIFSKFYINKVFVFTLALIWMLAPSSPALAGASQKQPSEKIWSEDKRFVDNGDGTITDTKTNLMWMKQDSYQRTGHWIDWAAAFNYVKKANEDGFANHYDWQMPTMANLKTLFEPDKTNSRQVGREMIIHIDPIFAKEGSGIWWALEDNGHFNAFGIEFNNGNKFSAPKKSIARKVVRPMRAIKP